MNSPHQNRTVLKTRYNDATADTATPRAKAMSIVSSNTERIVPAVQLSQVLLSTYRVPRQRRQTNSTNNYTTGIWSEQEQHQFLTGLSLYGWGQWKEIGTIIPTR